MSLVTPSANITNGVYKIFNVQYPNQDADLLSPGGANGTIGGYETNNITKRMQWEVTNVLNVTEGQITLINQEIRTYASARGDTPDNLLLVGNPDVPLVWTATPANNDGEYFLTLVADTPIVWTLADGTDRTPITVQPVAKPQQDNQLWKFVSVN